MSNFFVESSSASYLDINKISIFFRSKHCSGQPSETIPSGYLSTSPVNNNQTGFTETLKDTCLAYFIPGSADPSNKANLDALTLRFKTDYTNWRKITFDYVFAGICAIAQSPIVDTYEFNYSSINSPCSTRIYTYPLNYDIQELGHFDYSLDCVNAGDTNLLNWDQAPWICYYGPPGMCVTATSTATATAQGCGNLQLARFGFMEQDGRLVHRFFQYDVVSS